MHKLIGKSEKERGFWLDKRAYIGVTATVFKSSPYFCLMSHLHALQKVSRNVMKHVFSIAKNFTPERTQLRSNG